MTPSIDLRPDHRKIVEDILRAHLPHGVKVWVFGSRAEWTTKDSSDLDVALESDGLFDTRTVMALELAFEESRLPFRVDVVDLARVDQQFRDVVLRGRVALMGDTKQCLDDYTQQTVSELIEAEILEIGDGYRAKNSELAPAGLPFARAANVHDGFRFEGADCFPAANLDRAGRSVSQVGDVAFTSKGTVGRVAFVQEDTPRFVYAPQVCYWRSLNHERVVPRFLYCWMRGESFRSQLNSVSGQTDMAAFVSLRDQRTMRLALPPPERQHAIAQVIGALDDRIELNRRMNQTLEAMARALFKSWFVDFDPVRAKMQGRDAGLPREISDLFPDELVESELGLLPEGWKSVPIYTLATVVYGAPFASRLFNTDGAGRPLIRIRDLASHEPQVWTEQEHKSGHLVHPGDIVVGMDGEFRLHIWKGKAAWLNQRVCCFQPKRGVPRAFLAEALRGPLAFCERSKVGTTVIHLGKSDIDRFQLLDPGPSVLEAFIGAADSLLEQTVNNARLSQVLRRTRDTLLPKLVSGEVRLPSTVLGRYAEPDLPIAS